jgi:hypothetical protein
MHTIMSLNFLVNSLTVSWKKQNDMSIVESVLVVIIKQSGVEMHPIFLETCFSLGMSMMRSRGLTASGHIK